MLQQIRDYQSEEETDNQGARGIRVWYREGFRRQDRPSSFTRNVVCPLLVRGESSHGHAESNFQTAKD